jgi:hypothetical protein
MNKFSIFSFGQIINKIWIIKFEVLCNVEMNYVMNKWGGLVVKELNFYSWGPRIKLHKLYSLQSMLEYKLNILNLPRILLSRLGGLLIHLN